MQKFDPKPRDAHAFVRHGGRCTVGGAPRVRRGEARAAHPSPVGTAVSPSGRDARRTALACAPVLLGACAGALAHTDGAGPGGFVSGVLHPLLGPDHLVAMVAVGLWGAFLGRPAIWLLPIVFPTVMALGGALGIAGVPLPGVEIGIAGSGVLLGLAVAFGWRAPLGVAAALAGAFAVFHGHAHGTELPEAAAPLAYAAGFVLCTGALHLAGIAFGELRRVPRGDWLVRGAGVVVALVGAAFLVRAL